MNTWVRIAGLVKEGYGVASGNSDDARFPAGTLAMQKPFFRERGLDLDGYFLGTINVAIFSQKGSAIMPHSYEVIKAKHTFRNVKWSPTEPAEDFSFFDCRISVGENDKISGLIYYPHPDTKPEHFQASDILEVIVPFISDLTYGKTLIVEVDAQQLKII